VGHVHDRTSQVLSDLGDHLIVGVVRPQKSKSLRKVVGCSWVVSGEVGAVNGGPDNLFYLGNGHTFPVHQPSVEPKAFTRDSVVRSSTIRVVDVEKPIGDEILYGPAVEVLPTLRQVWASEMESRACHGVGSNEEAVAGAGFDVG